MPTCDSTSISADVPPETALPGRDVLLELLDARRAQSEQATLVLADIDGFRHINGQVGRATGDRVLQLVGQRVREAAHREDVVTWLGGDEFVVVCEHGSSEARALAERLCGGVRVPLVVERRTHHLTMSIGVSTFDGRSSTLRNLAAANTAVRLAKERGRDRVEMFDEGLRTVAINALSRTTELRAAVQQSQLRLHFQPVVDLQTSATVGCEGLLRWEHPVRGVLPPAGFLDVAASSGMLDDLTAELVEQAASAAGQLAALATGGPPYVSLNIGAQQLASAGLVPHVRAALARHELGPGQLMIEITETTVLGDLDRAASTLHGLKDLGVTIALDDFGTGYSSLLHLRRLPVDVVKIDRSFVSAILRDRNDLAIVASVVDLAQRLGLRTIAEGVEADNQAATLRELGCQAGQGFLWSRAVPLAAVQQDWPTGAGKAVREADGTRELMLRLHANGASPHTVAAALNAAGARNERGRRWHARAVAKVLDSAYSAGPRGGVRRR